MGTPIHHPDISLRLEYLLQRLTTFTQQHLMGYDFTVEYKLGLLNGAAYALSQRHTLDTTCCAKIVVHLMLLKQIKDAVSECPSYAP